MTEAVLVATLGMTPGVVTTTIDLLAKREPNPLRVEKVFVLTVPDTCRSVEQASTGGAAPPLWLQDWRAAPTVSLSHLLPEFRSESDKGSYASERGWPVPIELEARVLNIASAELVEQDDNDKFFEMCVRTILDAEREGRRLVVSLAGGRKAMSALLFTAALLTGCEAELVHVAVERDCERYGSVDGEYKHESLHPLDHNWKAWLLSVGQLGKLVDRNVVTAARALLKDELQAHQGANPADVARQAQAGAASKC